MQANLRWCRTLSLAMLPFMLSLVLVGCSHEAADWKTAKAADTGEAYQQFLTQHPNSANVAQARARITELQEEHDWQAATSADTRVAYEQFLAQHADSKWAQEARIRIENFAQSSGPTPAAGPPARSAPAKSTSPHVSPPHERPGASRVAAHESAAGARRAGHYVQLGAFSSQSVAESHWKRLSAKYPGELATLRPRFVASRVKARHLVRLQVGVDSDAQAKALCARLKSHAQACVPVKAG